MLDQDPKYQSGEPADPTIIPEGVIISPDTRRENRIPPGQSRTRKWPVLQWGPTPEIPPEDWTFEVGGMVEHPLLLSWSEYRALPRVQVFSDFHCVTRWSRLGNLWEGVAIQELVQRAGVKSTAKYVIALGNDDGWTTNMPLADFLQGDVLLADTHDGVPINFEHGGPVRLVVPQLYAWKSAFAIRTSRDYGNSRDTTITAIPGSKNALVPKRFHPAGTKSKTHRFSSKVGSGGTTMGVSSC